MRIGLFLTRLIEFVVALAEAVLLLRIILRLFAANPNAPFVSWVYQTSNTLLEPFRGIFPSATINMTYVLDFTALFALIVYALFGALLIYVSALLDNSSLTHSQHK